MIVKVISRDKAATLIEWCEDGQAQRSIVPSIEVRENNGVQECEYPERGMSYGVNFADYITKVVTPDDIEIALKQAGVWTIDDLLRKPQVVQSAFAAAYGRVLKSLIQNVKGMK